MSGSEATKPGQVGESTQAEKKGKELGKILYDTTGQFLPESQRQALVRGWTTLAKKYSHPRGVFKRCDHRILRKTGKSGLTPSSWNQLSSIGKARLDAYQRSRLHGFTSDELHRFRALTALDESEVHHGLRNAIHPVFRRSQWFTEESMPRHRGAVPILGDHDGFWLASNQKVWEILKPCLQLATLIISNDRYLSWFDALFNGRFEVVENTNPTVILRRFYRRTVVERLKDLRTQTLEDRIQRMKENVRCSLFSGYENTASGLPDRRTNRSGLTRDHHPYKRVEVKLAIECLQPLLRKDLTDVQKMALRTRAATTLAHEFCHAFWRSIKEERKCGEPKTTHEPYFEDEPLPELGYSSIDSKAPLPMAPMILPSLTFIHKVWGGQPNFILHPLNNRDGPGLPHMGFSETNWFTADHKDYETSRSAPTLNKPPLDGKADPFYTHDYWPVPTSWCRGLFREDLWIVQIRKFGAEAERRQPLEFGTRYVSDENTKGKKRKKMEEAEKSQDDEELVKAKKLRRAGKFQETEALLRLMEGDGGDIVEVASFEETSTSDSLSPGERSEALLEAIMALRSAKILMALRSKSSAENENTSREGVLEENEEDSLSDEECDFPTAVEYSCPRWTEITEYLFKNRGPLQLALDTMGILSEPSFYRYIRDQGGISLTPKEFRNFLSVANRKQELFIWEPFPGAGAVMRVDRGWPPAEPLALPEQEDELDEEAMSTLDNLLSDPAVQLELYKYCGEARDLDMDNFHRWLLYRYPMDELDISENEFRDVIVETVRQDGQYFTLGPKGIVRFSFPIDDLRAKAGDWGQFTKERMKLFEEKRDALRVKL